MPEPCPRNDEKFARWARRAEEFGEDRKATYEQSSLTPGGVMEEKGEGER